MQFLLVEDDADLRREVGEYLRRRHHSVVALASAAEAQAFLERRPTLDAVLCDVNLPDGDGFALYVRHAVQLSAVRWVLLTGDADQQELDEIRRVNPGLPPAVLVEKPVSLRRLAALLERGTASA